MEYASALRINPTGEVLVIRAEGRDGRIDIPRGRMRVQDLGNPITCALRCLREDLGYLSTDKVSDARVIGSICLAGRLCHVVLFTAPLIRRAPEPGDPDRAAWVAWDDLRDDPRTPPYFRVLIPLALTGVEDWSIVGDAAGSPPHALRIIFPT